MTKLPMFRTQNPRHRDLVATLELRTAQAILPHLQRQRAPLHFFEAHLAKEIRHVSESENRVERKRVSFLDQRLHHAAAYSARLPARIHRQRTNLSRYRTIKMQRPA